jgi:hypothetical protein
VEFVDERRPKDHMGARSDKARDECFKCGGKGHYAVVCPTSDKKFTLVYGEDFSIPTHKGHDNFTSVGETKDQEGEEVEEEVLESSTLPLCVIRRILARQCKEDKVEDNWLHTNIFHTRVEHQG